MCINFIPNLNYHNTETVKVVKLDVLKIYSAYIPACSSFHEVLKAELE